MESLFNKNSVYYFLDGKIDNKYGNSIKICIVHSYPYKAFLVKEKIDVHAPISLYDDNYEFLTHSGAGYIGTGDNQRILYELDNIFIDNGIDCSKKMKKALIEFISKEKFTIQDLCVLEDTWNACVTHEVNNDKEQIM